MLGCGAHDVCIRIPSYVVRKADVVCDRVTLLDSALGTVLFQL